MSSTNNEYHVDISKYQLIKNNPQERRIDKYKICFLLSPFVTTFAHLFERLKMGIHTIDITLAPNEQHWKKVLLAIHENYFHQAVVNISSHYNNFLKTGLPFESLHVFMRLGLFTYFMDAYSITPQDIQKTVPLGFSIGLFTGFILTPFEKLYHLQLMTVGEKNTFQELLQATFNISKKDAMPIILKKLWWLSPYYAFRYALESAMVLPIYFYMIYSGKSKQYELNLQNPVNKKLRNSGFIERTAVSYGSYNCAFISAAITSVVLQFYDLGFYEKTTKSLLKQENVKSHWVRNIFRIFTTRKYGLGNLTCWYWAMHRYLVIYGFMQLMYRYTGLIGVNAVYEIQ